MENMYKKCFVCGQPFDNVKNTINHQVNMPVCADCKNTENEKQKVEELLESLSEGFVCGCI
jgi:ribosome-binding protein aMBF1 (putative translation factor)